MKRIKFLLVGVLMLATSVVFAQNNQTRRGPQDGQRQREMPSAEQRVKNLKEKLQLTDKQAAEALKIINDAQKQREALRPRRPEGQRPEGVERQGGQRPEFNGERREQGQRPERNGERPDFEKMRAQMDQINANQDAQFKKIFTPEQYAKYQEMKSQRKPMNMRGQGNHQMKDGAKKVNKEKCSNCTGDCKNCTGNCKNCKKNSKKSSKKESKK